MGIGWSPHDFVGLLGLIGTQDGFAWPVDRVRQFGDRTKAPTDADRPGTLAHSIAALTDLDPGRDLAATLDQTVVAANQLFAVEAAGIMLADPAGRPPPPSAAAGWPTSSSSPWPPATCSTKPGLG